MMAAAAASTRTHFMASLPSLLLATSIARERASERHADHRSVRRMLTIPLTASSCGTLRDRPLARRRRAETHQRGLRISNGETCYRRAMTLLFRIIAWLLTAAVTFATLGPPQYRPHLGLGQD